MTVYIEYVLVNNFIIDFLLLKATFKTTGLSVSSKRLFFCALFSATATLLFPLISLRAIITTPLKICFGALIVALSAKFQTPKSYYVNLTVFFFYTFLTGGALMGVYSLLNIPINNELLVAVSCLPVYLVYLFARKVVEFIYRKKHVQAFVMDVEITVNGKTKKCKGFLDTGNGVYDDGSPVVFMSKNLATCFFSGDKLPKIKYVNVNTVVSGGQKIALKTSRLTVYNSDKPNIHYNITACVSDKGFEDGYEVILHPALLEDRNAFSNIATA